MEIVHRAVKGSGIFIGIRGKQLLLVTVGFAAALVLVIAWEGTPSPAVLLPGSIYSSSMPLYVHSFGFSNKSTTAVSDNTELTEAAEKIVRNHALTGDTNLENLQSIDITLEEASNDQKSVEESARDALNDKDRCAKASDSVDSVQRCSNKEGDRSKNTQENDEAISTLQTQVGRSENTSLQDGNNHGTAEDSSVVLEIPANPPVCDFSSGKWVRDDSRPAYSGETCKKNGWLSFMWACRIYDRPDFEYERYRWQPDGCDLPAFNAEKFLSMMKNQVLAFVGDSLGRQQFQSLMCLLTGGGEARTPEDVSSDFGFSRPKHVKPSGWAYRFQATNTTVLFHWSVCLCEIEPIPEDPENHAKMHLDRPAIFLRDYFTKLDTIVVNTGHHWNRGKIAGNKWIMYRDGKPVAPTYKRFTVGKAYEFTAYSVAHWLHEQMGKTGKTKVYMRSLSPRHFMNGDWNTGGTCDNIKTSSGLEDVSKWPTRDPVAEEAVLATDVRILNVTNLSQFRGESHVSKYGSNNKFQDCLHWCLPGVPDVWNEVLSAELFLDNSRKV